MSRVAVGMIAALTASSTVANDADLELGRHLASHCLACHAAKEADRIPSLWQISERAFTEAVDSFRSKRRSSQIMSPIAERLTDEDIAALARYFATARSSR